jgi:hypothetical protein
MEATTTPRRPPQTLATQVTQMRLTPFQLLFLTRFSGYASKEFKAAFDAKTERRLAAILD